MASDEVTGWKLETGVDTAGFLTGLLTGYEPGSILREQAQNADDACREQGRTGEMWISIEGHRVVVENPSLLTDDDWRALAKTSSRRKAEDDATTGEFGVGFWSVLHLTDAPEITSGNRTSVIDQLSGAPAEVSEAEEPLPGTRFTLPLRREQTEAGRRLEVEPVTAEGLLELQRDFEAQIPDLLLFTVALDAITLVRLDGAEVRGQRSTVPLAPGAELVTVEVATKDATYTHRYVRLSGKVANPPVDRNPSVSVVFPVGHREDGRIFCTFPTETPSGLRFSVNAHFRAAMDRRSISNSGTYGEWNDRIYLTAGRIVGDHLATLMQADLGLSWEDRAEWFAPADGGTSDISRRARALLDAVDAAARQAPVVIDRSGELRNGFELRTLDSIAEGLVGRFVEDTAPEVSPVAAEVRSRWGVPQWSRADVAAWVAAHGPAAGCHRNDAPTFLSESATLRELLRYLEPVHDRLRGVSVTLGSDDRFHPLGSDDALRLDGEWITLAKGLPLTLVHPDLDGTVASRTAPALTAPRLRQFLVDNPDTLLGRSVPSRSIGCLSSLDLVGAALDKLVGPAGPAEGVPLAVGPDKRVYLFDATTVCGLPDPHRDAVEALLTGLGARCLHRKLDDGRFAGGGVHRFNHRVLTELVLGAEDWNALRNTQGLLLAMQALVDSRHYRPGDFDNLAAAPIWPTAAGERRPLTTLYLPARNMPLMDSQRASVIDPSVVDPSTAGGRAARELLGQVLQLVDLDTTEDVVRSCENPPGDPNEIALLLEMLVDSRKKLHPRQVERLRSACFVPCADGRLRVPRDVILATKAPALPGTVGDLALAPAFSGDPRLVELLTTLGAASRPSTEQLVNLACWIAEQAVAEPVERDPAIALWRYLEFDADVDASTLRRLGEVKWLPAAPHGDRRAPNTLISANLTFAAQLFSMPRGVANPPRRLQEGLGIRGTLTPEEYVALAEASADSGQALETAYFYNLDRLLVDGQAARTIARLRDCAFLPVGPGRLERPSMLVHPSRAELWGHLRHRLDPDRVPNIDRLLRLFGLADATEIATGDHLEVLHELAQLDSLTATDHELAARRFRDLVVAAGVELEPTSLVNRKFIPTTLGIRRPDEVYRRDLPGAIVERLQRELPISPQMANAERLLGSLPLRSLRQEVRLTTECRNRKPDQSWQRRLHLHSTNIERFLHYVSPDETLRDWASYWPPTVSTVTALQVTATLDGRELATWEPPCHLEERDGELRLLIRSAGGAASEREIVDAIAALVPVSGQKSLLVEVLRSSTAEEGAEALNWEDVAPLPTTYVPLETGPSVGITIGQPPDTAPGGETSDDDGGDARDDGEGTAVEPATTPTDRPEPPVFTPDSGTDLPPDEPPTEDGVEAADAGVGAASGSTGSSVTDEPTDDGPGASVQPMSESEASRLPKRPSPARHRTNWDDLTPFEIVDRPEADTPDLDFGEDELRPADAPRRRRCVLSFYDVTHGLLPLKRQETRALAGATPLKQVRVFDEVFPAEQAGDFHVRIEGGARLYETRLIPPGAVVHLDAGAPGTIEVTINEDPHVINDVWILEINDEGRLERHRVEAVQVMWETDDRIYRPEKRWEDIAALHAEADASALELVIKAFERCPANGMTDEEVWQAVAVNRLFALSTIRSILQRQPGLFERDEHDHWHMTGTTVYRDRITRSRASTTGGVVDPTAKVRRHVRDLFTRLSNALGELPADDELRAELLNDIVARLDLPAMPEQSVQAVASAAAMFLRTGHDAVIRSIRRDVLARPYLGHAVLNAIEDERPPDERGRRLVEVVLDAGSSSAALRAVVLAAERTRAPESPPSSATVDDAERAFDELSAGTRSVESTGQVLAAAYQTVAKRSADELFDEPELVFRTLARLERLRRVDGQRMTDLPQVVAARSSLIAHADATWGDADRHSTMQRQAVLALVRLLQGDATGVLDVMKEYAALLRGLGLADDAAAVSAAGWHFAEAQGVMTRTSRVLKDGAGDAPAATTSDTVEFLRDWCAIARVDMPR